MQARATALADLQKLGVEPFPCPPLRPLVMLHVGCEDPVKKKELAECNTVDENDIAAVMQHF